MGICSEETPNLQDEPVAISETCEIDQPKTPKCPGKGVSENLPSDNVIDICTTDKKENIDPNMPSYSGKNPEDLKSGNLLSANTSTPANKQNVQSDDSTNLDTGSSNKKAAPIDNFFSS